MGVMAYNVVIVASIPMEVDIVIKVASVKYMDKNLIATVGFTNTQSMRARLLAFIEVIHLSLTQTFLCKTLGMSCRTCGDLCKTASGIKGMCMKDLSCSSRIPSPKENHCANHGCDGLQCGDRCYSGNEDFPSGYCDEGGKCDRYGKKPICKGTF